MVDFLLCLAWLAIILVPAVVAHYRPVLPKDVSIDFTADDLAEPQPGLSRAHKR
jgi:hypothetical protein